MKTATIIKKLWKFDYVDMFFIFLLGLFIILKLANVLTWPWWAILWPLWAALTFVVVWGGAMVIYVAWYCVAGYKKDKKW